MQRGDALRPDLAALSVNTIRPRRVELAQAGLVVKATRDGKVIKRDTSTGAPAQVWVVSAAAKALIRAELARERVAS